jgi:hypothetical protein
MTQVCVGTIQKLTPECSLRTEHSWSRNLLSDPPSGNVSTSNQGGFLDVRLQPTGRV